MKVAVFSSKPYDRDFLVAANRDAGDPHELLFLEVRVGAAPVALADQASKFGFSNPSEGDWK